MSNYQHWQSERDDSNRLWLGIDKAESSANVLSGPVLRELDDLLNEADQSPPSALIVYSLKKSGFVMGADINEFTTLANADEAYALVRLGQQVLDRLESARYPTVAAMDGMALGGGLELAMACHYRIAVDVQKPVIGLPEVQLGIHPGFGGTVRAVQLAGVAAAMPLMLTGKSVTPGKALKLGLVDQLCERDQWRDQAIAMAEQRPPRRKAPLGARLMNLPIVRGIVAKKIEAQTRAKANPDHYPAPFAIIDLWRQHGASASSGYEAEARSIATLMVGGTAQNLVRVFFLRNGLKGQGSKIDATIQRVHVVGAGVMGGDIAAWCALKGLQVSLQDRELKYITPALQRAEKLFEKKSRTPEQLAATKARLRADVAGDEVADADIVIEAIYENADAKQALYQSLLPKMKPGAILATNTSSIKLETLREGLREPNRFIGVHFFNPVAYLDLVEVVRTPDTEQSAVDFGVAFVKKIGKLPLVCLSSPGFVVNRILAAYMGEAFRLAAEGVSLPAIDDAATNFGMPMGPIELADTVGLDIGLSVARILGGSDDELRTLIDMVDAGTVGRKSGQGFYRWENGKVVKPEAANTAIPADLTDRLILPMVNEAVKCLDEGVVESADLLDGGVIFGTGFAPFNGGPLQYARQRGVAEIIETMQALARSHGEHLAPAVEAWSRFEA
ncbi:MAG: 3-hydroxyacyl-CoA dehydrogenase NAD-binding domain-containing protein [Pseudomonadota bacterium]